MEYLNRKRSRRGEAPVEPIYTREDARETLPLFVSVGEGRPVLIANGVTLTFHNAGNILGSAFVELAIEEIASGKSWRLVFSGDLGRDEIALLRSPAVAAQADFLIMESTYGGRLHGQYDTAQRRLRDVVCETARRRGKVIIPSFAVGRTQEIVYALNQLDARGDIPEIKVFVDSPLAINATDVFRMHPESWDTSVQAFMEDGRRRSPFDYPRIEYGAGGAAQQTVESPDGAERIIISASGMAESGRILHHLKNNITRPENTSANSSAIRRSTRSAGAFWRGTKRCGFSAKSTVCGQRLPESMGTAPTQTRRSCSSGHRTLTGNGCRRYFSSTASRRGRARWRKSCGGRATAMWLCRRCTSRSSFEGPQDWWRTAQSCGLRRPGLADAEGGSFCQQPARKAGAV